jgi:hypothetical protein
LSFLGASIAAIEQELITPHGTAFLSESTIFPQVIHIDIQPEKARILP